MGKREELGKIDPKCWLCAKVNKPTKVEYKPNICDECLPGYKERSFLFIRASEAEIAELFPIVERKQQ